MNSKAIGITGHQKIPRDAMSFIRQGIKDLINEFNNNILCVSSLAAGADQLFANSVLKAGGKLHVIIPCEDYETTFSNIIDLKTYNKLVGSADIVEKLDFSKPSEDAFLEAGRRVVDSSDMMLAIWDGKKANGKGGTADVVEYSKQKKKKAIILWPTGIDR